MKTSSYNWKYKKTCPTCGGDWIKLIYDTPDGKYHLFCKWHLEICQNKDCLAGYIFPKKIIISSNCTEPTIKS